jgi:predicted anti-sigma-YlaC factor YlaD
MKDPFGPNPRYARFDCCILLLFITSGCATLEKAAVRGAGELFAGDDAVAVFTSDDDPELVRDSLPFAIKALEILLAQDPGNSSLRLAVGRLYVQYANAFLQSEADYIEDEDLDAARQLRRRAAKLYSRGRDHALTVLEQRHPGFRASPTNDNAGVLESTTADDVPALFWAGASWAASISVQPDNMERVGALPVVEGIMRRALELDPEYDEGAVHEFFIAFEGGRGEMMGGSTERATEHYKEAVRLSGGRRASPHVTLAETVAVGAQDVQQFRDLLDKALAVDVDAAPEVRLLNVLSHRRARWLLTRTSDLFLDSGEEEME